MFLYIVGEAPPVLLPLQSQTGEVIRVGVSRADDARGDAGLVWMSKPEWTVQELISELGARTNGRRQG